MKLLPNEPDEPEQEGEGIETYHLGGGWYEVNGEKIQGKANALELLEGDKDA